MKKLVLLLSLTSGLSAFAGNAMPTESVRALNGSCQSEAAKQVADKYNLSQEMPLRSQWFLHGTTFLLGFGKQDDDCQFFYDVTLKIKQTSPATDIFGDAIREAVTCDVLDVQPDSNPEDCG